MKFGTWDRTPKTSAEAALLKKISAETGVRYLYVATSAEGDLHAFRHR